MLFPWPKCIERLLEEPDYETCETRRWMAKFHWSVCGPFRVQRRTSLVPSPTRPQGVRKNLVWDLRLRRTPKKTRPSNWRYRDLDRCIACLTAGLWVYILKVRFIVYSLLQEVMHCTNWISQARTFFAQTVWLACTDLEGFWPFFFFLRVCVCVCVCVWYLVSQATPFAERGLAATTQGTLLSNIAIRCWYQVSAVGATWWLQRDQTLPLSVKVVACETIWYHPELFVNVSSFTYLISALQFWRCQSMGSILFWVFLLPIKLFVVIKGDHNIIETSNMTLSKCLSFFCRGYQNSQWYGDSRSVPRVAPRTHSVKIKWSSWHGDTRTRASCSQSRDPRSKGWTHTLTNSGKWNRENINYLENGSLYSMCSDSGSSLECGTTTISPYFLHPQITSSGNN